MKKQRPRTASRSRSVKNEGKAGAYRRPSTEFEYERTSGSNIIVRDLRTGAAYTIDNTQLPKKAQPAKKVTEIRRGDIRVKINPSSGKFKPRDASEKPPNLFREFLFDDAAKEELKLRAAERARLEQVAERERQAASELSEKLVAARPTVFKHVYPDGRLVQPLTRDDVSATFRQCGFDIAPERLDVPSVESAGDYTVVVHLHHGLDTEAIVQISPLYDEAALWALVHNQARALNREVATMRSALRASLDRTE